MYVDSILNTYRTSTGLVSKVGLYLSPHLVEVRERIQINGKMLPKHLFARYFFEVWRTLQSHGDDHKLAGRIGYFPFLTLLSFYVFVKEKVEIATYETGVGGEYDVTNVIENPIATGVTRLGIDHVTKLGHTLEDIAWHKGGIFKSGCPAMSVEQEPAALDVLRRRAKAKGTIFRVVPVDDRLKGLTVRPPKSYQFQNASMAVALCEEALRRFAPSAVPSTSLPNEIKDGLEKAALPGRAEKLVDQNVIWHIDVAHTSESLKIATTWFLESSRSTLVYPLNVLSLMLK
jgi:folylpolyglutamate synthase